MTASVRNALEVSLVARAKSIVYRNLGLSPREHLDWRQRSWGVSAANIFVGRSVQHIPMWVVRPQERMQPCYYGTLRRPRNSQKLSGGLMDANALWVSLGDRETGRQA